MERAFAATASSHALTAGRFHFPLKPASCPQHKQLLPGCDSIWTKLRPTEVQSWYFQPCQSLVYLLMCE